MIWPPKIRQMRWCIYIEKIKLYNVLKFHPGYGHNREKKIRQNSNPKRTGWGCYPPPKTAVCPLLKKASDDPYLKLLEFSQLLVADAKWFFSPKFYFTPFYSTFETPRTNFCVFLLLSLISEQNFKIYSKIKVFGFEIVKKVRIF